MYTVKRADKTFALEESPPGDATLRRFKDVVSTVVVGLECGLSLGSFNEFQEGDEVECFKVEHAVKVLNIHPDANVDYSSGGAAVVDYSYQGSTDRKKKNKTY